MKLFRQHIFKRIIDKECYALTSGTINYNLPL